MEVYLRTCSLSSAFALVAVLAACGGGGPGAVESSSIVGDGSSNAGGGSDSIQSSPVKLNDTAQIIEYHGDSTVWGYEARTDGNRVATPAPDAFAASLPSFHTVRNRGVNRSTACDLLNGTGGYERSWVDYMKDSDATVVIINHSINDMSAYGLEQYRSCLTELVDIAKGEEKVVILETPNPAADNENGEQQARYVSEMKAIASQRGLNLIDQYAYLRQEQFGGTDPYAICPDGVHPSQDIYIEKGKYAAERFRSFDQP